MKFRLLLTAGSVSIAVFILLYSFLHIEAFPLHERTRSYLKDLLTETHPLGPRVSYTGKGGGTVIYVMGGGEFNLRYRYRVAAGLYSEYGIEKILIMGRSGITAYDPSKGRNRTNDEWSVDTLSSFGVPRTDIEVLKFKESFFGTLGETKELKRIVKDRGYTDLVIVTSLPHTKRVSLCFSNALNGADVRFYIYGSDDPVGLDALFKEFLKLQLYRIILWFDNKTSEVKGLL